MPCVGVLAMAFSGVTGGVSADRDAEGTLSSLCVDLLLGRGFMVDRCQRRSLTDGAVLALGAWLCVALEDGECNRGLCRWI